MSAHKTTPTSPKKDFMTYGSTFHCGPAVADPVEIEKRRKKSTFYVTRLQSLQFTALN